MNKKTIVYVNFSPYSNAGNILDYLKTEFDHVVCFTFKFHSLGKTQEPANLSIFYKHKLIRYISLFQPNIPKQLTFFLLPLRSFLFAIQIIMYLLYLKNHFGPFHLFFTVNALTAWTGNIAKRLGLVEKTVYWVWDYYPPVHTNIVVSIMRNIYWYFDQHAVNNSSRTVFLSPKVKAVHLESSPTLDVSHQLCVGIGTNPVKRSSIHRSQHRLVFLGVIKKSEGLDLLFDALELNLLSGNIVIDIIGGGPDLEYFKERSSAQSYRVIFHEYIPDMHLVDKLLQQSSIGIATYPDIKESVTPFTDPSKIKRYLSAGIPVITTNIVSIANEITENKAGLSIPYTPHDFANAVNCILKTPKKFQKGVDNLSQLYYYKRMYKKIFY